MISKNMPIPEIVDRYPFLIDFFSEKRYKVNGLWRRSLGYT